MKRYSLLKVDHYSKRFRDSTDTHLNQSGFTNSDGIGGSIIISDSDALTHDMDTYFLVTIEAVPKTAQHISEWGNKFIEQKKTEDANKTLPPHGRIFRS